MDLKRLALAGLVVTAGLGAAACTDGYGYSGVGVGYGAPGYDYYGGYADPYYGSGFASSYFGWYGNFYYPGSGIYVYDRYRRPYRWNGDQQRYWQGRRGTYRGYRNGPAANWNGFAQRGGDFGRGQRSSGQQPGLTYRGQPNPTGQGYAGRPFVGNRNRGAPAGTTGFEGYRRAYPGANTAVTPNGERQGGGNDARSFGTRRFAPAADGRATAAPQGAGRNGGGRRVAAKPWARPAPPPAGWRSCRSTQNSLPARRAG